MNSYLETEVAVPGTLCEPCDERGRKKVPATRVVNGEHWCDDCWAGTDGKKKSGRKLKIKPERDWDGVYKTVPPPPGADVDISADSPLIARTKCSDQWEKFFDELKALPPTKARKIESFDGRSVNAVRENIRRRAETRGIEIRFWKRDGILYIAAQRPGGLSLPALRRAVTDQATA